MTKIINIKNLNLVASNNNKLINQISLIHFHNLPSSFFTASGFKFVVFFYQLLFMSKDINLLIAREDDLNTSGFIIWGPINHSLIKTLAQNLFKFNFIKLMIIFIRLFNLKTLKKLLEKLYIKSNKKKFPLNSAKIISLVVDDKYKGKGIGTKLLSKVFQECSDKDLDFLLATTTSYQKRAVKFYNSLNFDLISKKKLSSDYVEYTLLRSLK